MIYIDGELEDEEQFSVKQKYLKKTEEEKELLKKKLSNINRQRSYIRRFPLGTNTKYKYYYLRALDKNFEFEFTEQELIEFIKQNCNYCGTPNANGIDRINSAVGYSKENTTPCCKVCNIMKFTNSSDKFLDHINKIYDYNRNKINN